MKTINKLLLAAVVVGGMASCETDIETPKLEGFYGLEPKELTASTDEVVMEGLNEDNEVVTFAWGSYEPAVDNPAYQVPDGSVQHYLEMSATPDFTDAASQLVEGQTITFTESELNPILINLGYEPWQSASLYVRVQYYIAANVESQYSLPIILNVTPYGIRFNRMDVLATDRETVLASIYSPGEDGVYTGYVAASSWMNFYLVERDNTLWGSVPGSAFKLSTDQVTFYNLWFPGNAGSYRLTADTNTEEWTAEYLNSMTLTASSGASTAMAFKQSANSWTANVVTTEAETFSATATTLLYSTANENGEESQPIDFGQILSIPEAGNWTVIFNMTGEQPTATYAVNEEPVATYEPYLEMIDPNNWDDVKCRLFSANSDGKYIGFYYSGEWENYKFATEGRETVYGSQPSSLFELDASGSSYNIYIQDGKEGLYRYSVSLPDNTWEYQAISSLVVRGDHDLMSVMAYDAGAKVWTADLDIQEVGWGMQILIDDNWDYHFKSKGEGVLGYQEGDNILPPGPGRYRLTINLYDGGNMTYTFTAL